MSSAPRLPAPSPRRLNWARGSVLLACVVLTLCVFSRLIQVEVSQGLVGPRPTERLWSGLETHKDGKAEITRLGGPLQVIFNADAAHRLLLATREHLPELWDTL